MPPIPPAYWNLAGSLYAYLYIELSRMQIDLIGMSQMVGYPTQFPSVSMMDWRTTSPMRASGCSSSSRIHFHPGDQLVETSVDSGDVAAQAFLTPRGRKLLLANKRNRAHRNRAPRRRQSRGRAPWTNKPATVPRAW